MVLDSPGIPFPSIFHGFSTVLLDPMPTFNSQRSTGTGRIPDPIPDPIPGLLQVEFQWKLSPFGWENSSFGNTGRNSHISRGMGEEATTPRKSQEFQGNPRKNFPNGNSAPFACGIFSLGNMEIPRFPTSEEIIPKFSYSNLHYSIIP